MRFDILRYEMLFNTENFFIKDFIGGITYSNFVFSNNENLRGTFFDLEFQKAIGTSNCHYAPDSAFLYCAEEIDPNIGTLTTSGIDSKLRQPRAKNTQIATELIQFLWLIRDNSIGWTNAITLLQGTTFAAVVTESKMPTKANGKYEAEYFTIDEIKIAHDLWVKYRTITPFPENYNKEDTLVFKMPNDVLVRTRESAYHAQFNYNQTNCIERAIHFLNLARNEEYLIYKIGFYMASFECLFTTEPAEITTRMSYRVAFYIGESQEQCKEIFDLIYNSYNIRSKFLHGQKFGSDSDIETSKLITTSSGLDIILRKVFLKIINHDSEVFTKYENNDRSSYLNSLIFDLPFERKNIKKSKK